MTALGALYLVSALYLTGLVSFTLSLLEEHEGAGLWRATFRRWGKFLLGLVVLGAVVGILSLF